MTDNFTTEDIYNIGLAYGYEPHDLKIEDGQVFQYDDGDKHWWPFYFDTTVIAWHLGEKYNVFPLKDRDVPNEEWYYIKYSGDVLIHARASTAVMCVLKTVIELKKKEFI